MIKEIHFTGYSAVPSDYDCPDGQLAQSLNLLNEDGSLRPLLPPLPLFPMPPGHSIFLFSPPSGQRLFISWNPDSSPAECSVHNYSGEMIGDFSIPTAVSSFSAIGNTIVALGRDSLYYILFRPASGQFSLLGSRIPSLDIDFSLELNLESLPYDASFSLLDPADTQTPEQAWQLISSASLDGDFSNEISSSIQGYSRRWHCKSISNLNLEAGKEYRISFNRLGFTGEIQVIVFSRKLPSGIQPSATSGSQWEQFKVFETTNAPSGADQSTFIPTGDIPALFCYVIANDYHIPDNPAQLQTSISVEVGNAPLSSDSKTIEYNKESLQTLQAALAKFINEKAVTRNRFIFPFFTRFALRLYDGSHVAISPPRLMIPFSGVPPLLFRDAAPRLLALAYTGQLQYRCKALPDNLDQWKDIIVAVDIFVSPQVFPYDQSAEYDPKKNIFVFDSLSQTTLFGFGAFSRPEAAIPRGSDSKRYFLADADCWVDIRSYQKISVAPAPKSSADVIKELTSARLSQFYLLDSVTVEDLKVEADFKSLSPEKGTLSSLEARQHLDEEFVSYHGFAGASAHIYNNRLHIFNASAILPTPSPLPKLNPFNDGLVHLSQSVEVSLNTADGRKSIAFESPSAPADLLHEDSFWFFYPDSRAVSMRFSIQGYDPVEIPLRPHPFLNGAYAIAQSLYSSLFSSISSPDPSRFSQVKEPSDPVSSANLLPLRNAIFISDPANPFVFRNSSVVTVGASEIRALSSAAKALSQGQFGQFPLYAFTDEGIWALEVSASGVYSARQPISRDVCRSADSITQIDSAVLFATDRGIMLISGSQTQCISDVLNSPDYFDFASLPGLCAKFPEFRHPDSLFIDFIKKCRMAYDYLNQRIILFNPDKNYAYVYSMKSKLWGIQECSLTSVINSYPDALALAKREDGNYLVDLSHSDAESVRSLLVSRPLKFDSPDILKTLATTIQRGRLPKHWEEMITILYGTRDYHSWHLIGSSRGPSLRSFRGSPYKAFRIVSVASLHKGDTIAGATFDVLPRMTNRLR